MKFCVIANCQTGPLSAVIQLLCPDFTRVTVPAIHTLDRNNPDVLFRLIDNVDVIIHQPIGVAFRKIAIDEIKNKYPSKKYISFPSIYFDGYFPSLMYLRKPGGGTLQGVLKDYHDGRVVAGVIKGLSQDNILNDMYNVVEKDIIQRDIDKSLQILGAREQGLDISILNFLKENIYKKRMFYVFNHPANDILIYVAEQVCEILGVMPLFEGLELARSRKDYLTGAQAALDCSILPHLATSSDLDVLYATRDKTNERIYTREEYVCRQIKQYLEVVDLKEIFDFSIARKKIIGY
jgi:hypothetical protein